MFGSSKAEQPRKNSWRFMLLWGLLWLAMGVWLARNVHIVVDLAR